MDVAFGDLNRVLSIESLGLSPVDASKMLAEAAVSERNRLIASGQASPTYTIAVDGRLGASEESVKPDGTIRYEFSYGADVAHFALDFAIKRSPSSSGAYRAGFFIAVNGVVFKPEWFARIPPGAVLMLCNEVPYHRKLDAGSFRGKTLRLSVPPGIMEDTAAAINVRFGDFVTAERVYNVPFERYRLKTGRERGKPVQSPAVSITQKES